MDPNDPNYYSTFGSFFNPQNFSNPEDVQNSQYFENSQFSPYLNQIPTSHEHPISQNISRNLLQDVQQPKKNQKATKNIAWCVKEGVALISSWICISEDSKREKNQKGAAMWERVQEMYLDARKENQNEISEKNIESMKGRFKRLNENANKWIAACKEENARKRSGMSQKDIEMEAHSIYEAGGSKFQDLIVFNDVMIKHPKWNTTFNEVGDDQESGGSTKRSKTSEDSGYSIPSNPETPIDGSTISRSIGTDKAKSKGKGKVTTFEYTNNEMYEEVRALRLSRDYENELMIAKIELEREKLEMNSLKIEKKMLVKLLGNDHLSPEEEEMKSQLIALLFGK